MKISLINLPTEGTLEERLQIYKERHRECYHPFCLERADVCCACGYIMMEAICASPYRFKAEEIVKITEVAEEKRKQEGTACRFQFIVDIYHKGVAEDNQS